MARRSARAPTRPGDRACPRSPASSAPALDAGSASATFVVPTPAPRRATLATTSDTPTAHDQTGRSCTMSAGPSEPGPTVRRDADHPGGEKQPVLRAPRVRPRRLLRRGRPRAVRVDRRRGRAPGPWRSAPEHGQLETLLGGRRPHNRRAPSRPARGAPQRRLRPHLHRPQVGVAAAGDRRRARPPGGARRPGRRRRGRPLLPRGPRAAGPPRRRGAAHHRRPRPGGRRLRPRDEPLGRSPPSHPRRRRQRRPGSRRPLLGPRHAPGLPRRQDRRHDRRGGHAPRAHPRARGRSGARSRTAPPSLPASPAPSSSTSRPATPRSPSSWAPAARAASPPSAPPSARPATASR